MKPTQHLLAGALLCLLPFAIQAGSVTIPNTFANDTPADANQVNANFNAVKSAVDDNDTRITANTTAIGTKQTDISQSCATGSAMRIINDNGTISCEVDDSAGIEFTNITTTTYSTLTDSVVASIAVTAPSNQSGYVLLQYSSYVAIIHTAGQTETGRWTFGTSLTAPTTCTVASDSFRFAAANASWGTGTYYENINMSWVYSVAAGTTTYFYVCTDSTSQAAGDTDVRNITKTLSGTFVPNRL